ncbi:MAG: hypothetical protein C0399_08170 [Syntrophus sp. (in: bacteria)]|nr:hypothetical protein [Syntrophus sp. (in: bacteria)]
MNGNMSEYINKFYDLQAEATKEVMKMTFFLNYGGIAATLTAFGSSFFRIHSRPLISCLVIFLVGLAFAVFMAIELRTFAFDMFSKATEPSATKEELETAVKNHRGRRTVYGLCIASLAFFASGIIVGFIVLVTSF